MIITCADQAGNEAMSTPAYFIVDRTPPSITVIKNWQDDRGLAEFNDSSACFSMSFVPGTVAGLMDRYDSQTEKVLVEFIPKGYLSFLLEPYTTTVYADYNDNYATNNKGDIDANNLSADGKIDPTGIYVPNVAFQTKPFFSFLHDVINLPDDEYAIKLTAFDKAGNETVYYDENKRITVNRGRKSVDLEIVNYTDQDSVGMVSNGKTISVSYKNLTYNPTNDNDAGVFSYQAVKGDFEFTIGIDSLPSGNNDFQAYCGIMIRDNLSSNSRSYAVLSDQNNNFVHRSRIENGQNFSSSTGNGLIPPHDWLKVTKRGSTVTFYSSRYENDYFRGWSPALQFNSDTLYVGVYIEHNSTDNKSFSYQQYFGGKYFSY